jgi:hypothetical protein
LHSLAKIERKMTRDDLKSCSGFTVQVMVDGKEALGDLNAVDPEKAFITVPKIMQWTDPRRYYLSDEDIAGLTPNGPSNLSSRISLDSPQPGSN